VASAASKQGFANAVLNAGWECWAIAYDPDADRYIYSFGTEANPNAVTGSSKNIGGCISAGVSRANNNHRPTTPPPGGPQ